MSSLPPLTTALGSATPLTLGAVQFATQEAPESLPIGGIEQRLAITELAGGGRVVAAMGAQPKTVSWSGKFYSSAVTSQVVALQGYAVDGKERLLSWGRECYYCIVKEFTPPYRNSNVADYSITVEITRDANGILTISSPLSVDTQVNSLTVAAVASVASIQAFDPDAPNLNPDISAIQVQQQVMGPIAQASAANVATLLTLVGTAKTNALAYSAGLTSASASFIPTQQYLQYLSLIALNTQNGQAQSTIRVQGTSLYETAATFFGDVTQAFNLANANGIYASQLTRGAPTLINLPPLPSAA